MSPEKDTLQAREMPSGEGIPVSRWPILRNVRKHSVPYLMLLPTMILLLSFLAVPFVTLFYYSVSETNLTGGVVALVGLQNFKILFSEPRFLQNVIATIEYLVGVLVIAVPLAYVAAILISSDIPAVALVRTILLIPWVLAPVATAVLFKTMLHPQGGPITLLVSWLFGGGEPIYLGMTAQGARLIIIIHAAWRSFPFIMIMLAASMTVIPRELYEAACVDGANSWQQFVNITLPLTRVPLMSAMLMVSVFVIQDAEGPYAITQGGPGYGTEVTGVRLFKEAFLYGNFSMASALGVVLIILAISVLFTNLRVIGQGEVA